MYASSTDTLICRTASEPTMSHHPTSTWHMFKRHIPRFLVTVFVDIVLPLLIYFLAQKHMKSVYALLLAGTPPLLMIVIKGLLSRTFDALGFLVLIGFVISSVVAIVTRNAIILLLEKSLVSGIVSLIFVITLIPCQCCHARYQLRPLAYYFYQDLVPTDRRQLGLPDSLLRHSQSDRDDIQHVHRWIYTHCSSFRRSCYTITVIWALGLLLEFLARLTLILVHCSVNKIMLYGNVLLTTITVICISLTIVCVARERKQTLAAIRQWTIENRSH